MRPLSDTLSLRTTAAWAEYETVEPIPVALGRVTMTPLRFNPAGTLWVLSDFPIMGVDAVRIDGVTTARFTFRNADDGTGQTVALLELGEALPNGAELSVDVRGLPDPETGGLLENPADVARWILRTYADRIITRAEMDSFRSDSANAGAFVSGLLRDDAQTIRACLDGLFRSVGAVWSGGMPGIAAMYPAARPADQPLAGTFRDDDDGFTATASATSIATAIEVRFDYDFSADDFRGTVRAEATDAIDRFGRIDLAWDAGWLIYPSAAIELATRLLEYRARATWRFTWTTDREIVGGEWVSVLQRLAPVQGDAFVTGTERDFTRGEAKITAETPAGAIPRIAITQVSSRMTPPIPETIATDFRGGVLTITVPSVTGAPIAGAKVTLDSGKTQTTDAHGRCQFDEVLVGPHQIHIEANGYQPMEYQITL